MLEAGPSLRLPFMSGLIWCLCVECDNFWTQLSLGNFLASINQSINRGQREKGKFPL